MTEEETISKAAEILDHFYSNFDLSRYEPFIHGTSRWHADKIMKEGLRPRGERRSVWASYRKAGMGGFSSPRNMVFFGICSESTVPIKAAILATRQAERENRLPPDSIRGVVIELKNTRKYLPYVMPDPDLYKNDQLRDSYLSRDIDEYTSNSTFGYVHPSFIFSDYVDQILVDIADLVWIKCGSKAAMDLVRSHLPKWIWSIYQVHSIAFIDRIIDPEDLEVNDLGDFSYFKRACNKPDVKRNNMDEFDYKMKNDLSNCMHDIKSCIEHSEYCRSSKEELSVRIEKIKEKIISYASGVKIKRTIDYARENGLSIPSAWHKRDFLKARCLADF